MHFFGRKWNFSVSPFFQIVKKFKLKKMFFCLHFRFTYDERTNNKRKLWVSFRSDKAAPDVENKHHSGTERWRGGDSCRVLFSPSDVYIMQERKGQGGDANLGGEELPPVPNWMGRYTL